MCPQTGEQGFLPVNNPENPLSETMFFIIAQVDKWKGTGAINVKRKKKKKNTVKHDLAICITDVSQILLYCCE